MPNFNDKVCLIVKSIPSGKVLSYGQVALYLGIPRAARQVGWTLNSMGIAEELPWWRVVNNQGRVSIKGSRHLAVEQAGLLAKEGVKVGKDLTFDIEKYRFVPDAKLLISFGLDPVYLETVSKKVPYSKYFPNEGRGRSRSI